MKAERPFLRAMSSDLVIQAACALAADNVDRLDQLEESAIRMADAERVR